MPLILNSPGTPGTPPTPSQRDFLDFRFSLSQGANTLDLTWDGAGYRVMDVEGMDDPVMSPTVDEAPGVFGGFYGGLQVPAREVVLSVCVEGAGGDAFADLRSALRAVTNPMVGPTTITCTDGGGRVHRISGWRFVDSPIPWTPTTWGAWGWQTMSLQFRCPNPWWRRPGAVTTTPWTNPGPSGFLGSAFLPVRVSSSTIFGVASTVTVPGDVPALPVWTITGAADDVTVEHGESGRSWTLDTSGLSRPVIVRADPDPNLLMVEDGDGADQWIRLAAPYDVFPLPPGRQTVSVSITGADTTTKVEMGADSLHLSVLG